MGKRKMFILATMFVVLAACRSHIAHVYSGVDPDVRPSKSDSILFVLPDGASIRERNLAVLLKDELKRSGFNLIEGSKSSTWTLSFAVDRQTYTIGSTTRGSGVAFGVYGVPMAVGTASSKTTLVQQTDVTIFMHLLKAADLDKPRPMAIWEGSVRAKDNVFKALPNSMIKNLLDQFGRNFERTTKVDKSYQKEVNASKP